MLYPPDPTSENDCTIGGTIATNASGPRSLKYGATRGYVRALDVILPSGEARHYRRRGLEKDTTGYGCIADPVDWFIGAEGTLGVVTHAELQLVEAPEETIAFRVLESLEQALDTVVWLRESRGLALDPADRGAGVPRHRAIRRGGASVDTSGSQEVGDRRTGRGRRHAFPGAGAIR